MKNAQYWFREVKNKEFRDVLLERLNKSTYSFKARVCRNLKEAIYHGFIWDETPEGLVYWLNLRDNPKELEALANKQTNNMKKLEKQYQKLGDEIAKLKEEKKEWWQEGGFAVSGIGDVLHFDELRYNHLDYYKQGRLFKTSKEAVRFSERERLLAEISREEGARPFVASEYNYSLFYHYDNKQFDISANWTCYYPNNIYFKTEQQVQKVIDKYGTKLNILL